MANFNKYTNYNDKAGVQSVVFGSNAPLLEVELNEMQEIFKKRLSDFAQSFLGNDIVNSLDYYGYSPSDRVFTIYDGFCFVSSGYFVKCGEMSVIVPTTEEPSAPIIIEFWEDTVSSEDTLYENGYQDSANTIHNYLKDDRFPVETSRRKVLKTRLLAEFTDEVDGRNYFYLGDLNLSSYMVETSIAEAGRLSIKNDILNKVYKTLESYVSQSSPVFTGSISMGRKASTTVGSGSTSLGTNNTASGSSSMAVGEGNTASGMRAIALGYNNTASGSYSFAVGNNNTAGSTGSISMGYKSNASADYAFCIGNNAKATGTYGFCIGSNNTALQNQLALGCYDNTTLATQGALSGADTGTFLVIGNGTSSAKSNAFRVQGDGAVYSKGAYNATGADYAEYAEWADGNPDNEDRRGYFVVFDEEKPNMIRKAKATDIDILGVVSGNPCVIGNSDECWTKQFLTDEFGNFLYETVEEDFEFVIKDVIKQVDPKTGNITEEEVLRTEIRTLPVRRYIQNPDYDPEKEYVHRRDRKEWSAVGWIGVLPVREDGTCEVGGYCTWGDNGLATKAEPSHFNYRVLERVSDNIVKVAIK